MIERAAGAGTSVWVVAVLALLGLLLGGLTGRRLADGGYRTEYDEAGALPRVRWWPAPSTSRPSCSASRRRAASHARPCATSAANFSRASGANKASVAQRSGL